MLNARDKEQGALWESNVVKAIEALYGWHGLTLKGERLMLKNTKRKLLRITGLLAISLFAFSQSFLSGCGNPASGDESQAVSQTDSSSDISGIFRFFTRSDGGDGS